MLYNSHIESERPVTVTRETPTNEEMAVRTEQFDTLYSGNKNGSVQQWTISVSGSTITKVYGQVNGSLQTTTDVIRKGKNLGRSNATTPVTQARAEAKSQWE